MGVATGGAAALRGGAAAITIALMVLFSGPPADPARFQPAATSPSDPGEPVPSPTPVGLVAAEAGATAEPRAAMAEASDPSSAPALPLEARFPCLTEIRDVEGQGLSCMTDAGWRVFLEDGSSLFTHGPDHAHPAAPASATAEAPAASGTTELPPPFSHPVCATDPSTQRHGRILVAAPQGVAVSASRLAEYRSAVLRATSYLREEAARVGAEMSLLVRCDAMGHFTMESVTLPEPQASYRSFGSIVSDLRELGFRNVNEKYWVFYEGRPVNAGGQGSIYPDDAPGSDNRNNLGPAYALVYAYASSEIFLHEIVHTLGAVQKTAPHTTGAYHCTDGLDLMCYADGGPSSGGYTDRLCSVKRFDCGNDDYFSPLPAAGTYLATHWNLGAAANVWMTRCAAPDSPVTRDLAVCRIDVPRWSAPGKTLDVSFAVYNFGLVPEDNARLRFLVEGAVTEEVALPMLPVGGPHVVTVRWTTPEALGALTFTGEILPATTPGSEDERPANNEARQRLGPITVPYNPVPRALRAITHDATREVTLTWAPPLEEAEGAWAYRLYVRDLTAGTPAQLLVETSETFFVHAAPGPGRYAYTVAARDGAREGNATAPVTVHFPFPPAAPRGLTARPNPVPGEIVLSWAVPASTDGQPVAEYVLERTEGTGSSPQMQRVSAAATSLVVKELTGGVPLTWRIAAVTRGGQGAWSEPVTAMAYVAKAPPAPLLTATSGPRTREITLVWTLPEEVPPAPPATRFEIHRVSPGGAVDLVATVASAGSFVDRDVRYDRAYTYTVVATNAWGASPRSAPAAAEALRGWAPRAGAAIVNTGLVTYLVGGYEQAIGEPVTQIVRYDPVTGSLVTTGARLPEAAYGMMAVWDGRGLPLAGCPGGCAYFFGGFSAEGAPLDAVLRYSPALDTITFMSSRLPVPTGEAAAIWTGDAALVFGASSDGTVVRYDPLTDEVRRIEPKTPLGIGPLAPSPVTGMSAVWDGTHAYLFGGRDSRGVPLDGILRFNPVTAVLETVGRLPSARVDTAAVLLGGEVFVLGGEGLTGSCIDLACTLQDIVRFTPATGRAATEPSTLPSPRARHGAIATARDLHLFGGCEDPRCEQVAERVERIRMAP